MASNKLRNTLLPHVNHPKLPTGSSLNRSASNKSSTIRNLKSLVVEPSQLGDNIKDQDAIIRPWQSLSNLPNVIDEESEDECKYKKDGSITTKKKNVTWSDEIDPVLVDALLERRASLKRPSRDQKNKNKTIVYEELRSFRLGMDVVAMALKKGSLRNYTDEQLYNEITRQQLFLDSTQICANICVSSLSNDLG